jgi:hypothetical protein
LIVLIRLVVEELEVGFGLALEIKMLFKIIMDEIDFT